MRSALRPQSERGVALITVLLMMAVLSGLAVGFSMTGQTEAAMAANEVTHAGARAAAEAGMNRAVERIVNDTVTNLLAGPDGATSVTATDAVNADNGDISFLFASAGPYPLDATGQYSYTVDVLDDDDPRLYQTVLTAAQKTSMGEMTSDSPNINDNQRLILRATGFGPKGTVVRLMRELQSVDNVITTTTTSLANPAILIDGDLDIRGNIHVEGAEGNVHANGNLSIGGAAADIIGDATATGTFTANLNWNAGGAQGGGRDAITVPNITASDYLSHADYILTSGGVITYGPAHPTNPNGGVCVCAGSGWSTSGGNWSVAGNSVMAGTFYAQGSVTISGSPGKKGAEIALSIISEGSIRITGTPKFTPENDAKLQFVTNGDLHLGGNVDLDDPTAVEGQIFVREQLSISGNPEFQGRILVQNEGSVFSDVQSNSISGNPTITYNGTLGVMTSVNVTSGPTTYTNNVRGWMEQ
jgi:Tfp pilus assembly protein PilX/cytoskeletal protein CcmA (bactofilin family)